MLADEARQFLLNILKKKLKFIKKNKENGFDPVTIADIKIQKKLNRLILKYFPNHSIIGEEESFIKNSGLMNGALIQLMEQNLLFKVCRFGVL